MMVTRRPSDRADRARRRPRRRAGGLAAVALLAAGAGGGHGQPLFVSTPEQSGTTALLQAVSVVDSATVWVSGHRGTFARTTDGGATWSAAVVPGAAALEFRDVYAVDARTAYLLAAGPGDRSRIYKTTDAGATWQVEFTNRDSSAFFDCFDFWDATHGIAVSDAVGGHFLMVATDDGRTWHTMPAAARLTARPGEGGFAASGTCVTVRPSGRAWVGTGSAAVARVLRTQDRGRHWTVAETPIRAGTAAGITSIVFRDDRHGVALGGSIADTSAAGTDVAITDDGGRRWRAGGRPTFAGAIYGGAYVPGVRRPVLMAVGPKGAAASRDDGRTWVRVDTLDYWSVGFAGPSAGWGVGPAGRITKFSLGARP